MAIDIRTLAIASLIAQLVLIAFVFGSVYLARKRKVLRHCAIVRGAIVLQIIAILAIMVPSMLGYVENVPPIPFFYPKLLIHHTLGLVLIALFVYFNLEVKRVVRPLPQRKAVMWLALGVWLVTLALGVHIHLTIYAG